MGSALWTGNTVPMRLTLFTVSSISTDASATLADDAIPAQHTSTSMGLHSKLSLMALDMADPSATSTT
jgi:hypothetical protein